MEVFTKSARETQKLGEKLASDLGAGPLSPQKGAIVICLYGDLGSGKTTFLQGFARGLGIKQRILSPTFILMRDYKVQSAKCKAHKLYHVDLYRIDDKFDVETLGLREIWSDPDNIIAIEWAEKIEEILPKERINIYFEYSINDERKVKIK